MRHLLTIFLVFLPRLLLALPNALPPPVVPQCFGARADVTGATDPKLDRLESGGFVWACCVFRWADVEKTKDIYDFTGADALLDGLAAHHLKPVFVLDSVNGTYPPGPVASAAFARFVTAAVQRYHGRTILWESGPTAPAQHTAHLIKAADPGATVIAAPEPGVLRTQLKQGLLAHADAVALPAPPSGDPDGTGAYETTRRLLRAYAPSNRDVPVVSPSAEAPQDRNDSQTRPQFLVRRWLADLAAGVRLSLCDDVTDAASAPTLIAARIFNRTLNGYRFIKRIPLTSPDDYLLLFSRGTDGLKLVAWTAKQDHTILLPAMAVATMTGMTGNDISTPPSAGRLALTLTGSPVYLDVSRDGALREGGAWVAGSPDTFYAKGRPLRLAVTYHNPDRIPHRVRFVALLTTPDGKRTPVPAGEDIVGPLQTLTVGMQAPPPTGSNARVRLGLILDGRQQPYPQDIQFAPLMPLPLAVAPPDGVPAREGDGHNL